MRALASRSRHGLEPDADTLSAMTESAPGLAHLPQERVYEELKKIMGGDHPTEAMRLAYDTGLFHHFMPEAQTMHGFDQYNKHHNQLLHDHSLNVLDLTSKLTKDPTVRMAAFLHDIGKPGSQFFDADIGREVDPESRHPKGWGHYYRDFRTGLGHNHEELGAGIANGLLRRLKFPNDERERITHLIKHHMFAPFQDERGARKFINRMGDQHADDLLSLRSADAGNKANPWDGNEGVMRGLLDKVRQDESATSLKGLAVNGNDLIQMGVKPGPEIGSILNELLQAVIENPQLNNKATLLGLLKDPV
jgi:tRNA nucleotidyltransferase (CCA-adding enzyme)